MPEKFGSNRMRSVPCQVRPELDALIKEAARKVKDMGSYELEAMLREQREGWVRAEMSWPRDCPYR